MSAGVDIATVPPQGRLGNRAYVLAAAALAALLIAGVAIGSTMMGERGLAPDFAARLQPPSVAHWLGTDQLGRDMLARSVHGLSLSLLVGLAAATVSVAIAMVLAVIAATGGKLADAVVAFLVDLTMGLPHLVLLILIAFAMGSGTFAVIVAVAVTHWPRLTRILRAELMQLRQAEFVLVSRRLGKSWAHIGRHHFLPHLWPQMLVGLVLMFPHAILHEAALSFIGFGLEPSRPAIGVMLADAMRHLMAGRWWLGVFPGLGLLTLVLAFDALGNGLRLLADPRQAQT